MATPELTRVLEAAIESHQPPLVSGRRIKLRYAHQAAKIRPSSSSMAIKRITCPMPIGGTWSPCIARHSI